jgi:hypothetical protein
MKEESDPAYLNQRHDPNSLRPNTANQDLAFELTPVSINEGDLKKYLQRTASLVYDDLLDTQMDTNLADNRPPNNNQVNANNPPCSLTTSSSTRSEQGNSKSDTIEQPVNGKRCGQDPISPHPKQAKRDKPTVETQLPNTPPVPVITHKHTPIARGNMDPRPFPYFVYNYEVVIYTMKTLQWDAHCPYKITAPRTLSVNAYNAPTDEFLMERVLPGQGINDKIRALYRKALADFNRVHKSTEQYCAETVTKPKVYTSIFKDVNGVEVNPTQFKQIHRALDWQLVDKIGDYIKILRARPIPRNGDNQTHAVNMEYQPNNVYSYEETRSMLWQHAHIKVKASRYWDDRFVRQLPKAVFYSLNDYCPGMPFNIASECESIGLDPFRASELQILREANGSEPTVYDTEKTVKEMVNNQTLVDKDTHTVEMYVEGCLNPLINKYWLLDKTWPFELPRLMIRLHAVRLKDLRTVLQEYTKGNNQTTLEYDSSAYDSARSYSQNTEQSRPGPNSGGLGGSRR